MIFHKAKALKWIFVGMTAALLLLSLQVLSETRLYESLRAQYIKDINETSEGIYKNLEIASSEMNDPIVTEQSLIGALLYARELKENAYYVPQYAILGKKISPFSGATTSPYRVFQYVETQLDIIVNEYRETSTVTEDSLMTIQLLQNAFSTFCTELRNSDTISQSSFIKYLDSLCNAIYPR